MLRFRKLLALTLCPVAASPGFSFRRSTVATRLAPRLAREDASESRLRWRRDRRKDRVSNHCAGENARLSRSFPPPHNRFVAFRGFQTRRTFPEILRPAYKRVCRHWE